MPNSSDFSAILWDILNQAQEDPDKLANVLRKVPKAEIVVYLKEFRKAVATLATSELVTLLYENGASDDAVDDVLAFVVSRGNAFFDQVLIDPNLAPSRASMHSSGFDGAAGFVYWERFGEEIELQL